MECLISDIFVSKEMMNKISNSGFCFQHLQLARSRNYIDGLTQLFKVACFGFNGPFRQYFSLYRVVSQREGERTEKR